MATFEWDEAKRLKTLASRGLDFANADEVFNDDYAISAPDPRYDTDQRWLLIGTLNKELVIVIAYKEPEPETYRIISMRKATKAEHERYEKEKASRLPSEDDALIRLFEKLKIERQESKPDKIE